MIEILHERANPFLVAAKIQCEALEVQKKISYQRKDWGKDKLEYSVEIFDWSVIYHEY